MGEIFHPAGKGALEGDGVGVGIREIFIRDRVGKRSGDSAPLIFKLLLRAAIPDRFQRSAAAKGACRTCLNGIYEVGQLHRFQAAASVEGVFRNAGQMGREDHGG